LALRSESDQPLKEKDMMDAIWDMVYQLFGEFGASQTGLYKIRWDDEKRILVVRCSHKALEMVRAAVAAVTMINGRSCALHVVAVSGTLKALQNKLQKQQI